MDCCLCCNSTLLRHFRRGDVYWFCPSCHQEMPRCSAATLRTSFRTSSGRHGLRSQMDVTAPVSRLAGAIS